MSSESDKEMAVSQQHPPDDKSSCSTDSPDYLSSLPNEVLVKIISLLPETQDREKLRYVSRRLQKISETPSLWREVVWRDCYSCEEERLHNVIKAHGIHIRRLSAPDPPKNFTTSQPNNHKTNKGVRDGKDVTLL